MFQSTFPHGERLSPRSEIYRAPYSFNPRSRTGNDLCIRIPFQALPRFQSTFPHGERLQQDFVRPHKRYCFNPRSRTGNDWIWINTAGIRRQFQSTFPHGERFLVKRAFSSFVNVSIHVPARGTIPCDTHPYRSFSVSIHVPARGTILTRDCTALLIPSFQSTFPHGERLAIIHKFPLCFLLLSMQLYQ